jgi:DNA-binding protein Fis
MNIQELSSNVASSNAWMRNGVRDSMEGYLKSLKGNESTEYGKMVGGFAEQLNDPLVAQMLNASINKTEDGDSLWKAATHKQRQAYSHLMAPYDAEQIRAMLEKKAQGPKAVDLLETQKAYGVPKTDVSSGALGGTAIAQPQWGIAMSQGVDLLKAVDREEKAGLSNTTWKSAFRSVVEGLDLAYRQNLGGIPGGSPAAAEITRQYEARLGELFDYAKARATASPAPATPPAPANPPHPSPAVPASLSPA